MSTEADVLDIPWERIIAVAAGEIKRRSYI
jgi:hypothetical protein